MTSSHDSKTILIVDDNEMNRELLCAIFEPHYNVLQAEDGQIALSILSENYLDISLILTDLVMPNMDGKELLSSLSQNDLFSSIPVVVVTGEESSRLETECLELGASDFLQKPVNASVALNRVRSLIRLRESDATLNAVETDSVTGLFTYQAFLIHAENFAKNHPNEPLTAVVSQLCDFSHFDDRYGLVAVSEYLRHTGDMFLSMKEYSVAGYFGNGRFATISITIPDSNPQWLESVGNELVAQSNIPDARVKYGVYEQVDRALSMRETFREAGLALERIMDDYEENVALYDEELAKARNRNRLLANEMEKSLSDGNFYLVYQPKHDAKTGALVGCEVLVRWNHPTLGFVSPGEFIPLFEQNGQVRKLDTYVRECAMSDMIAWKEKGLAVPPTSVNFSKRDLLDHECIMSVIDGCNIAEVGLPVDLFHVEVTETMWSEHPDIVIKHLNRLHDAGFHIELDDFGTGYSSLGMLVEMPIDVVKLDMSLVRNLESQEPVVRYSAQLAHELGMTVLAEGVEEQWQLDTLRNLGVDVIQGYYFSKPLTRDEFEEYIKRFS